MKFTFDWNPDRHPDAIRICGNGRAIVDNWLFEIEAGSLEEAPMDDRKAGACSIIDLGDFADDLTYWLEGLRRGVSSGYDPDSAAGSDDPVSVHPEAAS